MSAQSKKALASGLYFEQDLTLQGLRKIMTLVPIIGFLASAAIIAFFPLNTGQHADMIREIRQRRVENRDAQQPEGGADVLP